MRHLRIIVPAVVTALVTIACIFLTTWLTGLVPPGDWAEFIKASIAILIIGCTLLIVAWSAYFTYVIRKSLGTH